MGKKLIITAALCGAGTMKSQTPYVPVTPCLLYTSMRGHMWMRHGIMLLLPAVSPPAGSTSAPWSGISAAAWCSI